MPDVLFAFKLIAEFYCKSTPKLQLPKSIPKRSFVTQSILVLNGSRRRTEIHRRKV